MPCTAHRPLLILWFVCFHVCELKVASRPTPLYVSLYTKRWRKKAVDGEEWDSVIKEAKAPKGPYSQAVSKRRLCRFQVITLNDKEKASYQSVRRQEQLICSEVIFILPAVVNSESTRGKSCSSIPLHYFVSDATVRMPIQFGSRSYCNYVFCPLLLDLASATKPSVIFYEIGITVICKRCN